MLKMDYYNLGLLCRRLTEFIAVLFLTVILFQFIEIPTIVFKNSRLVNSIVAGRTYQEGFVGDFKNSTPLYVEQRRSLDNSSNLDGGKAPDNRTLLSDGGKAPDNRTSLNDGGLVPNPVSLFPDETRTSISTTNAPPPPIIATKKIQDVYTIADMNEMMTESYSPSHAVVPQCPSKTDQDLLNARSKIENAPIVDRGLYAPLYHNVSRFQQSYELMEKTLKVYIYKEGRSPIFHSGPLRGIYASEGWFMKLIQGSKKFVTKNPKEAHLFYLPFSSVKLEEQLFVPNSHSYDRLIQHLKNYIDTISMKYPFWNRTGGADHFLVACHDWAPTETKQHLANCIRALCNADIKDGFSFGKDVSLPETKVNNPKKPLRDIGGKPPSQRKTLAFFAGKMHGYLRPILLRYWQNKDPDTKIFGKIKGHNNYIKYMKTSKYCICPKGYEVNSPRLVEAIFYECVPVIISDNFVPPFVETLNWESFAVFLLEKDIPNLKDILTRIPERTYLRMQMRVKKVQRHFLWHTKPENYDLFHMILHSIWHNRVFQFRLG